MRVRTSFGTGGIELAPFEIASETYPMLEDVLAETGGKGHLNSTAGTLSLGKPWS